MKLPARFVDKMKALLGGEFEAFMASYESPRAFGLRLNPLKLTASEWSELSFLRDSDKRIPWTTEGFYYSEEERPGKHPYYHAGMYYIQEPSAMLPAELLDVRPGQRVLDLCAAPGGKTTQLAGKLAGEGVLVTNDNAAERTKALAKNVELSGIRNAIVLNEEPANIAAAFPEWFDRILVDAPCSGEGMFRKDDSMIADWERHSVQKCSAMQKDILKHAAAMLAPGGLMLYSTCTFSPEENEIQIASFLAEHADFAVEPIAIANGLSGGRPDWIDGETANRAGEDIVSSLAGTARLWPHLVDGEGHYAALLRRRGERKPDSPDLSSANRAAAALNGKPLNVGSRGQNRSKGSKNGAYGNKSASIPVSGSPQELWALFKAEQMSWLTDAEADPHVVVNYGDRVYLQPSGVPRLDGLKVVRAGWYIGEAKRHRFVPSQALAMGLRPSETVRSLDLDLKDDEESSRYLRGETMFVAEERIVNRAGTGVKSKGYVLICLKGRPIGWGKYEGGMLKNELSPGWRRT